MWLRLHRLRQRRMDGHLPAFRHVTAEAAGFAKSEADVTLLTQQNLSVPIALKVGSSSEAITVTSEAPLVNTADPQSTNLGNAVAVNAAAGRSQFHLPRNTSTGRLRIGNHGWWNSGRWGTPGSGVDNYSTETAVDVSAKRLLLAPQRAKSYINPVCG
jgi:hypothetical protein